MATACISQLRQMPLHCTPALAGFVCAAVLSPALVHGNRLHPQQVAFYAVSLELHPTPYRSALPGAALRPAGSICAGMLSLSNATPRIRAQLSHSQWPAFAVSCSSALALHRTPALAGFVCAAVLSPAGARQQAASAAGCLLCSKSGATSNSIPLSITKRCTPPSGLHLRSNAFA